MQNIVGYAGIDGLTKPFDVSGSDCWLDIEWQDATDAIEAARTVLATTVSNFYCKIRYVGFVTGDACVNAVRLIAVTGARIVVDAYGEFSTGVVEMVTTLSSDVLVSGYFYNDNVALTKNVVNTGGLSAIWYAYGYDGKGGYSFSGGSAAALAADDISTVATAAATLVTAAAQQTKVASVDILAAGLTGTTTRFTVSGGPIRVLSLGLLITTVLPAGANTLQFSFTPTGGGATTISGATETASAAVRTFFLLDGTAATGPVKTTAPGVLAAGQLLASAVQGVILSTGILQTVFSGGPPATGAATLFVEYQPLTAASTVA
jgi:hypothetical protein